MKKNLWLLGLLVFIFASCNPATESGTSGPKDTWSDITSLDQVDGTWVGTHSLTMPLTEAFGMLKLFGIGGVDPEMMPMIEMLIKDVNADIAIKAIITIDASEQTTSNTSKTTVTFRDGQTDMLWMLMKAYLSSEGLSPEDIPGVSMDDKSRSITMDTTDRDEPPAQTPITVEDLAAFQINQNRTKLKAEVDAAELGIGDEFGSLLPSEIILDKQ